MVGFAVDRDGTFLVLSKCMKNTRQDTEKMLQDTLAVPKLHSTFAEVCYYFVIYLRIFSNWSFGIAKYDITDIVQGTFNYLKVQLLRHVFVILIFWMWDNSFYKIRTGSQCKFKLKKRFTSVSLPVVKM